MACILRLCTAFFILLSSLTTTQAAWPTEVDSAIYVDNGIYPRVVVDNYDQSVFVVYINNDRLFVKKYDLYGDPLWGGNRITLADTTEMFGRFSNNIISQWGAVVPDDSGGLFVSWLDYRFAIYDEFDALTNDIYIQYVDRNGVVKMGPNGKRLNTLRDEGHRIGDMKTDYHGGVFVSFSADTAKTTCAVKRVQNDGAILWGRYFDGLNLDICASNPNGEVFINIINILPGRRQKLDINGISLWPDTLSGCIPDNISYGFGQAFADQSGGVYGLVRTTNETLYNQITQSGSRVFPNDVALPTTLPPMYVVPDNSLGFFFQSGRASGVLKYINRNGSLAWPSDSVKLCQSSDCSGILGIVPDRVGGVLGVWTLGNVTQASSFRIQRIDSSGQKLWAEDGIPFYESQYGIEPAGDSVIPVVSDGRGGAIVNWVLDNLGLEVYIKQVSANGVLGEVIAGIGRETIQISASFELLQNYPNPFNSTTNFEYYIHQGGDVELTVHNLLGQEVDTIVNARQVSGKYTVRYNASKLSSGIYFYRMQIDGVLAGTKKMLLLN